MTLRLIFMGTPDFSVPTLRALHNAGHEIVAVYSQPPRPAGRRGLDLKPSPVQAAAEELGISVFTPTNLKGEPEQQEFASHKADVAVVVAYGLLLPQAILDTPNLGCYNGHASLLPRWRGAAPIQRAIMAGDEESGIMVMKMEAGLDTGPIAMTARVRLNSQITAGSLHDQLAETGAELMVKAMAALETGELITTPQDESGILYAKKILKSETRIDWHKPALEVQRHIMGLSPFPGAWCEMEFGGKLHRVKILNAQLTSGDGTAGYVLDNTLTIACGQGAVQLTKLQRAGSKAMIGEDFIRGHELPSGRVLK